MKDKFIIGRKENIDLPSLGVHNIDAKIDTGAYTASIHCHQIKIVKKKNQRVLKFDILDPSYPQYPQKFFYVKNFETKQIKNSFGQVEKRYVIKLPVLIFNISIETEFSLTNRSEMKFPILLGRKFIQNRFVVDVSKINVSRKLMIGTKRSKKKDIGK